MANISKIHVTEKTFLYMYIANKFCCLDKLAIDILEIHWIQKWVAVILKVQIKTHQPIASAVKSMYQKDQTIATTH